jgi:hypothetical protein
MMAARFRSCSSSSSDGRQARILQHDVLSCSGKQQAGIEHPNNGSTLQVLQQWWWQQQQQQ